MNKRTIVASIFIVLAFIGLVSMLMNQPQALFRQLLFLGLFAAAIYAIYRFMTRKSQGKRENRAFIKAAKQSKKRLKDRRKPSVSSLSSKKKPFRKRSAAHLTVIEGKKGKKKNRASS